MMLATRENEYESFDTGTFTLYQVKRCSLNLNPRSQLPSPSQTLALTLTRTLYQARTRLTARRP